jgi:hypothetical protein
MAAQRPNTGSPLPTAPPPGSTPEPSGDARAVVITVLALGLAIGVLAAIPNRSRAAATPTMQHGGGKPTTTTTMPVSAPSTTSTTGPGSGSGIKVAILAAAGTSSVSTTRGKLSAAHYSVVPESPIPYSWVSSLTSPVVHYPAGYDSEALQVASTLGIPSSGVTEELSGTSYGSNVIEVFLPPT